MREKEAKNLHRFFDVLDVFLVLFVLSLGLFIVIFGAVPWDFRNREGRVLLQKILIFRPVPLKYFKKF
jgi:hypothetical protein